jgi:hypothetical protein
VHVYLSEVILVTRESKPCFSQERHGHNTTEQIIRLQLRYLQSTLDVIKYKTISQ